MALKYISELTLTNNIDDNDLLVVDDGSKNYAIKWSTLKAALATVSGFTVNNTNGTITITLATGAPLTVTPHDPTKQDLLTFDSAPTENSNNPVKSGGVFAALGLKLDAADYAQYTGATDQQAGTAGYVPAPVAGGERYLSSSGVWQAPDSTPTENSNKLITSDAVYAALLDLAEQLSDEYDATATYDVGAYCIHENKLYKCTTAIATAEAWNSAHWTATTVGAELGAKVNTSDIVNNLTSTATDKPLSAAQGKALNDAMTQYQTLTVNADSSKIENVTAKQIGKVVVGGFTIKANVLNSGYNSISFTISGVSWIVPPAVSVMTASTTDDGKNFYIKVTSASGIQIRASAANTSSLGCMFIGCIS